MHPAAHKCGTTGLQECQQNARCGIEREGGSTGGYIHGAPGGTGMAQPCGGVPGGVPCGGGPGGRWYSIGPAYGPLPLPWPAPDQFLSGLLKACCSRLAAQTARKGKTNFGS